jgi:hypothetical protein
MSEKKKPKKDEWKPDSSVTMTVGRDAWKSDKTIQMEIQETFQKKSKEQEEKK